MNPSSCDYDKLQQHRQRLLRRLASLRELRRGSLTDQFLKVRHADGSTVRRGPYPLLTRKEAGKTISVRLTDPAVVSVYRRQIQALREFESVVDELVRLGEQLGDLALAVVKQMPGAESGE